MAAQFLQENYEEALTLLQQAQREQGGAQATRLLRLTYCHMQEYGKAHSLLAEIISTAPGDREARFALAETLLALGQTAAATEQAEMLPQVRPAPRDHYLAARAYREANDKKRAIEQLESDPAPSSRTLG